MLSKITLGSIGPPGLNFICSNILLTSKFPNGCGFSSEPLLLFVLSFFGSSLVELLFEVLFAEILNTVV